MKFQNLQLQWDDLPKAETIVMTPVEKDYLKIIYLQWTLFFSIVCIAIAFVFYLVKPIHLFAWLLGIILFIVTWVSLTFWLAKKSFNCRAIAIREKDIIARSGWLFQQLRIIPIDKILHCVLKTGPLEKKYQLATLQLFTAGQQADVTLTGLNAAQAEQLKEWILSKQRANG